MRQAAAHAPTNAAIQHDLGFLCLQAGFAGEAAAAFRAALAANPRFALASLRLGVALQALGDEEGALAAWRQATLLQASLVEARFRAGALLDTLGRRDEALAAFRRGAASAPKTSLGRLCAIRVLLAEERDGEAERALRQLLARDAANATALDMLGTVLADAGRLDEARDCYDRATLASPSHAGSYYDLSRCRRLTPRDADLIARMQAALVTPGLHPEARLKLHLALGKAADDLDDPAAAMRHFDEADVLRDGMIAFDARAFEARIDRLIARCTPDIIARAAAGGVDDAAPVLIIGLPRSGTTLVEQILACHPDVHAGGEIGFWTKRGALWERDSFDPSLAAGWASDYVRLLRARAPNALRITDKMPLNILWAGVIHMALPRATIIHCRRRPIDVALSIHRTYFNQHVVFPTGGAALVTTIRAVGRLAAHWRQALPAERFIELDYEDLACNPEPTIRRLVDACGLSWNDTSLFPERNARIVRTPSKWQVRQPITARPADAWRRYEPWLGPLRDLLDDVNSPP
ncbi:tetratricopeptide repeat-containing sulfotransferase family protein [Lichenicoccus sp.]|uniref:tetratricopeptide repeat-containing sulfotransferase family protein n=1 Tax=Lichenicoccus sp. TaxID=2781899 RepID=UPI003D13B41D